MDDICYEDEPCWDCTTMGNQICGTTTTVVVAVADPPVPMLPSTGSEGGLVVVAVMCLALGIGALCAAWRK